MEDELWNTHHQSRVLQELRQRIAPQWDDEAARDLNLRYLNPHAEEDGQMLEEFRHQIQALGACDQSMYVVGEHVLAVERLSVEILEQLGQSEQELMTHYQYIEHHAEAVELARTLFGDVKSRIAEASAICKGVPKS